MKSYMNRFHPVSLIIYILCVLAAIMILPAPIILIISILSFALFSIIYISIRGTFMTILFSLPLVLLMAVINVFFNHNGSTPFLYYDDMPLTVEALLYGLFSGLLIIVLILWFKLFNKLIDNSRLIYLIGSFAPTFALMITTTLRYIPFLKKRLNDITQVQNCFKVSTACNGNVTKTMHLKNGTSIFSILFSSSLESSIDTADSMTARGYGITKRTTFRSYHFRLRDIILSVMSVSYFILIIICKLYNVISYQYYPYFSLSNSGFTVIAIYITTTIFLLFPIIYNVKEALKWTLSQQRI